MKEETVSETDWRHSSDVEHHVNAVLDQMTLDEKIELVSGDLNHMFGFYSAPLERLGIPELTMADGPPGVRINNPAVHGGAATALPAPIALAATWNRALAAQYGAVIGEEARASGHNVFLGPAVDIARVPVGGRNFESLGEDPILSAGMAVPQVEAIQKKAVLACVKHFAVNNQEFERSSVDVRINEKTLRELYLLPFEVLVRTTGLASLMGSFNKINGIHACENAHLLNTVLRKDWGFRGWVMSDYGATRSTVPSALAGLDQEQPCGVHYGELLKSAVTEGDVPLDVLDTMCSRILRTMIGLGLMDNRPGIGHLNDWAHRTVAEATAEEGIVLLKNDGLLPANPDRIHRVVVIGVDADGVAAAGGGSGKVRPAHAVSLLAGIRQRLSADVQVDYAQGADPITSADLLPGDDSIPSGFLRAEEGDQHGVKAELWSNTDFIGEPHQTLVLPQIALNLGFFNFPGFSANSARFPDISAEVNGRMSARFTTRLIVPVAGSYQMQLILLGSAKVYLDDRLIVDFRYHGPPGAGANGRASGHPPRTGGEIDVRLPAASDAAGDGLSPLATHAQETIQELAAPVPSAVSVSGGGDADYPADRIDFRVDLGARPEGHRLRIEYVADSPEQGFLNGAQIRLGWRPPQPLISPLQAEAMARAEGADLVVVAVRAYESEHADRPSIALPNGQAELVRRVTAINPRTVVVTMAGGAVDMRSFHDQAGAILHAWYPGQEQGTALARLIFGDANPSGKLPITFPTCDGTSLFKERAQYPGIDGTVSYSEGVMVGYRGYEHHDRAPLYRFGHGLSYTSFRYDDLQISGEADGRTRITCSVTNTGTREGAEIVQLYLHLPGARQPPKRLVDWQKIGIAPGASRTLTFLIDPWASTRPLSVWDGKWVRTAGNIEVLVGASSGDIRLSGRFTATA